jgi:hypothetical protein
MKGVIAPPSSVCTSCVHGMVMDRPSERNIFCTLMKRPVALDILRCTTSVPRGHTDPLWGGNAYAPGIVLDLRPETGQTL